MYMTCIIYIIHYLSISITISDNYNDFYNMKIVSNSIKYVNIVLNYDCNSIPI